MMTFTLLLLHLWGALLGQYVAVPFTKAGGGGGSPAFVDSGAVLATNTSATTWTFLYPHTVTAGHVLHVSFSSRSGCGAVTTETVTDSASNTYSQANTVTQSFTCFFDFWSHITTGGTLTLTLTSLQPNTWLATATQYSGVTTIDQHSVSTGTGGATNSVPSVTNTSASGITSCAYLDYYDSTTDTVTAGSTYTLPAGSQYLTTGNGQAGMQYRIETMITSPTCLINVAGTGQYTSIGLISFK